MTTWGGTREGAGRKAAWKHGETTTIRVPAALREQVLEAARQLDEGQVPGQLTIDDAHREQLVRQARELLAEHLVEVGRKGTVKRSIVRQALDLLESAT